MVFFCEPSEGIPWESPYLVNCNFSRPIRGQTSYNFARDLEGDLSRHPACQGEPSESFTEEHDIYALGVLLLEIGYWTPVVDLFTGENDGLPPTKSTSPIRVQNRLKRAAGAELPEVMGREYAEIVTKCLSVSSCQDRIKEKGGEHLAASIVTRLEKILLCGPQNSAY